MDFTLTADQELLRETARSMLAKECPTSLVRQHGDDRAAAAPLWRHLAEWTELATGPLVDLCLFLEETGAVIAPGPFLANAIAGGFGVEGLATVAMAGADGVWRANDESTRTFVLDADLVDRVAFVTPAGVAVVDAAGVERREVRSLDTTRRIFEVTVPAGGLPPARPVDVEAGLERAWVAAAAELLGTARWIFDATLAYAKQRVQFDRPIGSFQAVQHKLADMALARERAWSAVYYAAMCVDAGDPDRRRAAHVAKAAANQAAHRCATDGIQTHGGIGFTFEHDLHLFMRRAFATEALLGTTAWHHEHLADLILA
jgi:alkylation response protein AidB-like acyl-CoA dehydrogenase